MYCLVNDIYSAPGSEFFFNKSPVKGPTHGFVFEVKPREWESVSPIPGFTSGLMKGGDGEISRDKEKWHELTPVINNNNNDRPAKEQTEENIDSNVNHFMRFVDNNSDTKNKNENQIINNGINNNLDSTVKRNRTSIFSANSINEKAPNWHSLIRIEDSPVDPSIGDLPAFTFDYMNAATDFEPKKLSEPYHHINHDPEEYHIASDRKLENWFEPVCTGRNSNEGCAEVLSHATPDFDTHPRLQAHYSNHDPDSQTVCNEQIENWFVPYHHIKDDPEEDHIASDWKLENWFEPVNTGHNPNDGSPAELSPLEEDSSSSESEEIRKIFENDNDNESDTFEFNLRTPEIVRYDELNTQQQWQKLWTENGSASTNTYQQQCPESSGVNSGDNEHMNPGNNEHFISGDNRHFWYQLTPVNDPLKIPKTEDKYNTKNVVEKDISKSNADNLSNNCEKTEPTRIGENTISTDGTICLPERYLSPLGNFKTLKNLSENKQNAGHDEKDVNCNLVEFSNLHPNHESTRYLDITNTIILDTSQTYYNEKSEKLKRTQSYEIRYLTLLYEEDRSILIHIEYDEKIFELRTKRKRLIAKNHLLETIHARLKVEIDLLCDIKNFFRKFLLENNEIDSFTGDSRSKETEAWKLNDELETTELDNQLGREGFLPTEETYEEKKRTFTIDGEEIDEKEERTISIDEQKSKFDAIYRQIMGQNENTEMEYEKKLTKNELINKTRNDKSDSTRKISNHVDPISPYLIQISNENEKVEEKPKNENINVSYISGENVSKIPRKEIPRFQKSIKMNDINKTIGEQLETIKSNNVCYTEINEFKEKTLEERKITDEKTENFKLTAYLPDDLELEMKDFKSKVQLINRFKKHIVLLDVENNHLIDEVKRLREERDYLLQVKTYYRSLL